MAEVVGGTEMVDYLVGSLAGGIIDWILEHMVMKGQFAIPELPQEVPPFDDWLSLLIALAIAVAGVATRRKAIENIGKGALIYNVGMIIHHTLLRNVTWK